MRLVYHFLLILVIFWTFHFSYAQEEVSLEKYYSHMYLGEKKTKNYSGPLDPRATFSDEIGGVVFLDDSFQKQYLNKEFQNETFELYQFWFDKVSDKSTCPDEELGQNVDYIRYLFRLVSMSYLFEAIKTNNRIANELNLDKKMCAQHFDDLFSECHPRSDDMKKFKDRVYGKFVNEIDKTKYISLSKKETESWLELFHKSSSLNTDPTFARLHDWCEKNQIDCHKLDLKKIESALGSFCETDKKLIKNICNESDDLYGVSYASDAQDLIRNSNGFNLINSHGMGEDCLRRFVKINSIREVNYFELGRLFSRIRSSLLKEKSRYIQGELFLPGSLKEFDMKGLSDFLVALKPPKVEVVAIKKVKPKAKPVSRPVVVALKKAEPKVVIPEPVVMEEPQGPKISEFEFAKNELASKNFEKIKLDMDKFRDDFEFTSKMISELSAPIKKFQTHKALSDMKA